MAHSPALVLAVLVGVNVGPNLTYVGSLATLLWRQLLHARDAAPSTGDFLRLGLLTVPPCLAACGRGAVGRSASVGRVKVVVWLAEGTWEACVDAAREVPGDVTLVHVLDPALAATVRGAQSGLLGRGAGDAGAAFERVTVDAEEALFTAARARLGRDCTVDARRGRVEREVVAACADAGLLVVARDGDHTRPGPASLGKPTRFIVDHAPCRVLLVWPDEPPDLATIPPPPAHPPWPHPYRPPPPHEPPLPHEPR